ncbi:MULTISPECIES: hypothetical protein [Bacillus cereus group]|nr:MULTISPECIES: hypothetical protein [Bacillus cereus group]MDA2610696.1 hypothetical protein [Bacillus cereus]MEB8553130.1 hypothetical protein [Bacillus cereus]MEB8653103.1 hypothetical protein [Bacillus cereus]MEB8671183.1 hypothetical protein [Bacillus cereus]MEB8726080.1 hypothetical protein [Bacillus cereus]
MKVETVGTLDCETFAKVFLSIVRENAIKDNEEKAEDLKDREE